jgi:hypothetical protein
LKAASRKIRKQSATQSPGKSWPRARTYCSFTFSALLVCRIPSGRLISISVPFG